MGSKGSTGTELDAEKTRVREKTPEVSTSSKPAGPEEGGSATLRCASGGARVCASVASYASTLMIFRSIKC